MSTDETLRPPRRKPRGAPKPPATKSSPVAAPASKPARARPAVAAKTSAVAPAAAAAAKPGRPAPRPTPEPPAAPPAPARAAPPAPARAAPAAPAAAPAAARSAAAPAPSPAPGERDARPAPAGADAMAVSALAAPDFDALAQNMARLVEEGGRAVAEYVHAREQGEVKTELSEEVVDAVRSIGRVAEYWLSDPQRAIAAQSQLATKFVDLWAMTLRRMQGEDAPPVAAPPPSDKRFADPDWAKNPIFDFLRQAYVIASSWASDLAARAESLDPHTRDKAQFYVRQVVSALSPSNFIATNPELIRETFRESGDNLVRGMKMLAEDIKAGHGTLKIRQSDPSRFALGVNLATTPGKVVFRNELMELIQYAPTTDKVLARPLLIVPPWINKFYILDLNAEKSFIRWAVEQGLTVFTISWVNPDERHKDKDFASYMKEGIFAALEAIDEITGERRVTSIGYCVGGTLLSCTLAWMAARGDDRIASATLFTTQVDFTDAGDLRVFVDEEMIHAIEAKMEDKGYLEGSKMATAFNMLRPNDLIWSYWVNNYLKGKEPMPFDLLVWNSDSTRMPRANHSYYLRNCYLENNLTKGRMVLDGVTLDLGKVKIPIYELAAREDHIAPAKSVFNGAKFFGGPVRYVLAGSGHIAGVVNPPYKPKYQYWTGGPPQGEYEAWVAQAKETPGSWWPDWIEWIRAQDPRMTAARQPGSRKHPPIGDAPGEYVRMKA